MGPVVIDEEGDFLVCAFRGHAPGSIESVCSQCSTTVYIAPSGQELLRVKPEVKPICIRCIPRIPEEEVQMAPISDEQWDELRERGLSDEEMSRAFGYAKWLLALPPEER